jgi:hypothetical protein
MCGHYVMFGPVSLSRDTKVAADDRGEYGVSFIFKIKQMNPAPFPRLYRPGGDASRGAAASPPHHVRCGPAGGVRVHESPMRP